MYCTEELGIHVNVFELFLPKPDRKQSGTVDMNKVRRVYISLDLDYALLSEL